jgi:hypothetical protein
MRRISSIIFGVALLFPGIQLCAQANATIEKALEEKEKIGWQSWKDHTPKPMEEMTPEQSINIADGMIAKGKQQILKNIENPACTVKSFSLSEFSYLWLDQETVLMTYTATQNATCSGKKQAGKVIGSSLWQKKGGNWVSPFHQETDAGSM